MGVTNVDGVTVSFNEMIKKTADNGNAARTAIKYLNSYLGQGLSDEISVKDFEKIGLKKLATLPGIGEKSYILLVAAYRKYVTGVK